MEQTTRASQKTLKGVVVSAKMQKTVVVRVDRRIRHPMYDKVIVRGKKYYVHCEDPSVKEGDSVTIMQTRPLSKTKNWRVVSAAKPS